MQNLIGFKEEFVQDILVVEKLVCSSGHEFVAAPNFVLTQIPCNPHVFCTDEMPEFLLYGEGKTKTEIITSLSDRVCHFHHMYNGLEDEVYDEFPVLKELRDSFNERVKLVEEEKDG